MDALTYWWKRAKAAEMELEHCRKLLAIHNIEEALNKLPLIEYDSDRKSPPPGRRKDK